MNAAAKSNSELVAAYLDAVIRKDASAVDRYFDPNVEYMVNGTAYPDAAGAMPPISVDCHSALPWLGIYRGREAVKDFLAHMHRNLDVIAFGPREVISQGNKAAAFGWFRLRSLSTGRTSDIGYSIFFELRDGLIVKYHFLENTFDVARTFRTAGSWLIDTDGTQHSVPASETNERGMAAVKISKEILEIQRFTSSEAGAWSNAYLISGETDAILFDVFMLRAEAAELAKTIEQSGKTLQAVMISHAHPDHFMGLDAIVERFPAVHVLSTASVVADIKQDGPWIFSMLQDKLGVQGPKRLIIPEPLTDSGCRQQEREPADQHRPESGRNHPRGHAKLPAARG